MWLNSEFDLGIEAGPVVSETVSASPIERLAVAQREEIVFIEGDVGDVGTLLAGIAGEVHVLDAASDGLAQMAQILAGRTGLDAIHVISHGGAGSLSLGALKLDGSNVDAHQADLAAIGASLAADGDMLLYGCDVAAGSAGALFIDRLADATGADIAASTNLTGAAAKGGDWTLELAHGAIESQSVVDPALAAHYQQVLGLTNVTARFNTVSDNGEHSRGVSYRMGGDPAYTLRISGSPDGVVSYAGYGDPTNDTALIFGFDSPADIVFTAGQVFTITSLLFRSSDQNLVFKGYDLAGNLVGTVSATGVATSEGFTFDLSSLTNIAKLSLRTGANNYYNRLDDIVFADIHDATPPTLAITRSAGTLKIGETSTITFTFSEDPGATITSGGVTVSGGTLGALSGTGLIRTATFTPTANTNNGTANISVAGGAYADPSGNAGIAAAMTAITFDTRAPTLAITSNVSTLKGGETATITFTFSEDPGATFTWDGSSGDVVVSGGTLSAISGSGLTRTATFTPTANDNSGTASITVAANTYADAAGNNGGSGTTPTLTFDTLPPSMTGVAVPANASYRAGQALDFTVTFSEAMTFGGTGSTLSLVVGSTARNATVLSTTGATITYRYTVQAGDTDTDGIALNSISLNGATIRDSAGNNAFLTLASVGSTAGVLVDTTPPAAPSTPVLAAASDSGSSNSDGITNVTTPTFSGTAEVGSTVRLYDTDGTTLLGTTTATGGTWSLTTSTLSSGDHTVTAKATDAAGNVSVASAGQTVTIDTTRPTLAITSNVSSLKIGETATITFTFSEDPGADFDNDDVAVSGGTLGVLSGSGLTRTATFTPTASTNGGTASITVAAGDFADAAGNTGAPGAGATPYLVFDTRAPTLAITSGASALKAGETTTITFTFSEDPGASFVWNGSSGDVVVNGGTLSAISGSGLTRTATFTPTAGVNAGTASITVAAGDYTDAAGNSGGAGTTPSLTFDTLAPTLSISSNVPTLKGGQTATITFTFSEDPASSFTSGDIVVSGGILGAISGSGLTRTATFTPTASTNNGTASITVASGSYTDTAGNTGGAGTSPSLTFDTLAPAAPSTPDMDGASDTGASNSDNITDVRTPTFSGTAETSSTVRLYDTDGTTLLGTAVTTGGVWSITSSTLGLGDHTVKATATDTAGNVSAAGTGLAITIRDNRAPTGAVTITGTAKEGLTLTAANTVADLDGLGTISYRWQRDGADIGGAVGATYLLTSADVGAQVRAVASYVDVLGSAESLASATTLVSQADVTGPVAITAPTTFTAAPGSTVTLSGAISGTAPLTISGGGTVVLSGSGGYTGTASVSSGTLSVNGAVPGATINVGSGATLGGVGTVGVTSIGAGGAFAPGSSPGVLNTGNLTLVGGAAYNVEIASGSSYDQANVTGTVNLGGATLNLISFGGFTPQAGNVYKIVANDGTDAVAGTFAGLAEGDVVTLAGVQLTLSYRGGDGNDVTLSAPAAPSTGGGGGTTTPAIPSVPPVIAAAGQAIGLDVSSPKAAVATIVMPWGQVVTNPNYVTAAAVQALQADYAAGRVTAAFAKAKLVDLAMLTKGVAIEAYSFFTGQPPTPAGMVYLVNSDANGTDLTDPYYAVFDRPNRFINFAVNLGANGEGKTGFQAAYGALSFEQAVAKAYDAVIGISQAQAAGYNTAAGISYVVAQKSYFEALGGSDLGAKAAAVGYLLSISTDIHLGAYYQQAVSLIEPQVQLVGGVSGL